MKDEHIMKLQLENSNFTNNRTAFSIISRYTAPHNIRCDEIHTNTPGYTFYAYFTKEEVYNLKKFFDALIEKIEWKKMNA